MFGSSDELDDSPPELSALDSAGGKASDVGVSIDITARGVGTCVDTTQEARGRNTTRLAPQRQPWMLPQHLLNRWSGMTGERYNMP